MGKIVVSSFVSLDGVIQDPHHWSLEFQVPENEQAAFDLVKASDALLLGRLTYEAFAQAWPGRPGEFAERINSMPKYVASTTLSDPEWDNTTVLPGDAAAEVRRLKDEGDRQFLLYGSGRLMLSLMEHDLVDEYNLLLNPVVVGSGQRIFPEGSPHKKFKLVDATPFGGGIVTLRYQRA